MNSPVLILGCGYTGRRVARILRERGVEVIATSRDPGRLRDLDVKPVRLEVTDAASLAELRQHARPGIRMLHSIPSIVDGGSVTEYTPALLEILDGALARIVYFSTTGVYGNQAVVDEKTVAEPVTSRQKARREAELAVLESTAPALVLRAAAIYGRDRGVHVSLARGLFERIDLGDNFISRIHVEDLATLAVAGLDGNLTGAWPVADEEPCTAREMAEFCSELLRIPLQGHGLRRPEIDETRRADRRVNGAAVRRALGVSLRYPSYRLGVPGSL